MSPEQTATRVLLGIVDYFNTGPEAARPGLELIDPDAEIQDFPGFPGATWNYGHAGALQWAVNVWEAFDGAKIECSDLSERGGSLVYSWRLTGKGRRSGVDFVGTGFGVVTTRAGRLKRLALYETREDALEAAERL